MRWVVGLVLIAAAVLKAVEIVANPTVALAMGRWLLPVQIGIELGIGLIALSGLYWRQLRWLAIVLFTAFAAYSLYLATTGATSCGCFGPVRIHPWWTFSFDLAVVLGLLLSQHLLTPDTRHLTPSSSNIQHPTSSTQLPAFVIAISAVTVALLVRYIDHRTASAEGIVATDSGLVILEPEKWIGKELPIADDIDLDLSHGEWTAALHRHDCPACHAALPTYEELASMGKNVALIEVPPFGNMNLSESDCVHGQLTDDREWFVQTPVEIKLQDGIVTAVETPDH
jgi:hypothetical protein